MQRLMRRSLFLLALCFPSACLWRSYETIMRVHLEVIAGVANKILDKTEAGRRPTPNDITEMMYPLQRARQFLRQYKSHSARASYRQFLALLDRYEVLARSIDHARGDPQRWQTAAPAILEQRPAIEAAVTAVRSSLAAERSADF